MRFKSLFLVLAVAALTLSLGCGGGGGGSDGATVPTTYTVSGAIAVPAAVDNGWNGSVRGATISTLGLKVQALGKGGTALSAEQSVGNDGTFSFSVTPDTDAIIKASNAKGFDFRFHLGVFAANRSNIAVDASSTARAFLNWGEAWKIDLGDTDQQLANIVASITGALQAAPTGQAFDDRIEASVDAARTVLSAYQGYYTSISASNTALENIFKSAKNDPALIEGTRPYFSSNLNSTANLSGYGLENFISSTKSRYERYTVNSYSFSIQEIRFTSPTTASATVSLYINVTPKAGEGLSGSFGPVTKVIGWRNESGSWKVWQDFPYLKSQFGF